MKGEKVLEHLRLSLQGFDTNSAYSSVLCRSGISHQGTFSGPGGFNSNPAGSSDGLIRKEGRGGRGGRKGKDGAPQSFNSLPSVPSGEVRKIGRRREDLDLKGEEMVERRELGTRAASGLAISSGAS